MIRIVRMLSVHSGGTVAPKTERFEMRLDEEIIDRVDRWRSGERDLPSRSEAIRRLVDTGLRTASPDEVRLTDGEKLLAMMIRDLYKNLKVQGDIDPDLVAGVIRGGHYWALKWELDGIYEPKPTEPEVLRLVLDVLDMWQAIERDFEQLSNEDKARVKKEAKPFGSDPKFMGFDGNDESRYASTARFLIEKLGRYERFRGREHNSHMPVIDSYRRMLSVFTPMRATILAGRDLDASQIVAILKARAYPRT
jgi:uncharacterized protein YfbU (UPF0304 family)